MSQFDQIYDRRGTGSVKYDLLEAEGWSEDTLPLWVADMDFPAPACAGEALRELSRPGIFGYSFPDERYQAAVTGWFARRFIPHILYEPAADGAGAEEAAGAQSAPDTPDRLTDKSPD